MNVLESAILTAILGDCMGIPYEFPKKIISIDNSDSVLASYKKKVGGVYFPTELECQRGTYSDDTQMLLMTLRSLQYTDFIPAMISELRAFLAYENGAGRATRVSCNALGKHEFPWQTVPSYFSYGGNGVVMRVLPHAFQDDDIHTIMDDTFLNGILTHGSPVALVGAQLYVYYAWCIINNIEFDIEASKPIWGTLHEHLIGEDFLVTSWHNNSPSEFKEEWIAVTDNLIELYKVTDRDVDTILKNIPVCGTQKGAGTWCAIASILLSECRGIDQITLMKTVSTLKDADTDTLCCILGGLLGLSWEVPAVVRESRSCLVRSSPLMAGSSPSTMRLCHHAVS